MSGWVVENGRGQSYQFADGTTLDPGDQLTLHSGAGEDTDTERYWDADEEVWPEAGDTVRVETADGELVLTETYKIGR
jgi:hypothetical protein